MGDLSVASTIKDQALLARVMATPWIKRLKDDLEGPRGFERWVVAHIEQDDRDRINAWLFAFGPPEPGRVQQPYEVVQLVIHSDQTVCGHEFQFGQAPDGVSHHPFTMEKEHEPS
jgi:hypothetical protein